MKELLLQFAEVCFPDDLDAQEALIREILSGNIAIEVEDMRATIEATTNKQPLAGSLFDAGRGFSIFLERNKHLAEAHMLRYPQKRVALEWWLFVQQHPGLFVKAMLEDWGAKEIGDALENKTPI